MYVCVCVYFGWMEMLLGNADHHPPTPRAFFNPASSSGYHLEFSPFRVQHPRRFSKCSISDYKEFLLKGGGSCLFNRPTKVSSSLLCPFLHMTRLKSHLFSLSPVFSKRSRPLLAAVRDHRVWEWICRNGRGVWLRRESSEFSFSFSQSHLFVVVLLFVQMDEAHACLSF